MDDATAFAVMLAEEIAPNEVDIAPALLEATADRDVPTQARRGPTFGGVIESMGASDLALLIPAVKDCASILASLCLVGSSTLGIAVHRLTIRDRKQQADGAEQAALRQVEEAKHLLRERLIGCGIVPERAEEMSQAVLELTNRDTEKARAFFVRLAQRR